MEQESFLGHISTGMWVMFALGMGTVLLYAWKNKREKGVNKYLTLSLPNILFHVIASFMLFLTLEETGEIIIQKFIHDFKPDTTYHFTLSGLTGMFGSVFVAMILELGKRLLGRNKE